MRDLGAKLTPDFTIFRRAFCQNPKVSGFNDMCNTKIFFRTLYLKNVLAQICLGRGPGPAPWAWPIQDARHRAQSIEYGTHNYQSKNIDATTWSIELSLQSVEFKVRAKTLKHEASSIRYGGQSRGHGVPCARGRRGWQSMEHRIQSIKYESREV